jgi:hypothetical protein
VSSHTIICFDNTRPRLRVKIETIENASKIKVLIKSNKMLDLFQNIFVTDGRNETYKILFFFFFDKELEGFIELYKFKQGVISLKIELRDEVYNSSFFCANLMNYIRLGDPFDILFDFQNRDVGFKIFKNDPIKHVIEHKADFGITKINPAANMTINQRQAKFNVSEGKVSMFVQEEIIKQVVLKTISRDLKTSSLDRASKFTLQNRYKKNLLKVVNRETLLKIRVIKK